MAEKKRTNSSSKLWLVLASIIMAVIFVMILVAMLIFVILFSQGIIPSERPYASVAFIYLIIGCFVVGAVLSAFISKLILKPVTELSFAFERVSAGDFSARVQTKSKITEISEMYANFNAMAHELSGIETLRNDFVVNVSHEFKTPIAAIEGYAALLQAENLTKEQHDLYVEKVISNVHRLSDLTGNILRLSKLENQEVVTDKKIFRLDEQIRQTVLALEGVWENKNIAFDINLPKINYYGSEGLLYQVWYNIIGNAVKFSHEGGNIALNLFAGAENIAVEIADDGIGMDEETQKHVFEKFYQGDKTHKAEGNGLGLALVKRIIDLCGGSISVQSSPNKGTKFTVTLPVLED